MEMALLAFGFNLVVQARRLSQSLWAESELDQNLPTGASTTAR